MIPASRDYPLLVVFFICMLNGISWKVVNLTRLLGSDRLVSMTNGKDAKIKFEMIK